MISIEIKKEPDSDWNKNLMNSELGTVYQTQEYGIYIQAQLKSTPLFLKFYSANGELVGQVLVFQSFMGRKRLAKLVGRGSIYSTIAKASTLLPKYTEWFFGPVFLNTLYQKEISESFGQLLNSWGGKIYGSSHPLNPHFDFPQKFNFKKTEAGTFIIDLKESLDVIFQKTDKHSVQKNIKRSKERGVRITQISSKEDLIIYHKLLNDHRLANGLTSYSIEDVIMGYDIVKPVGQIGFLAWLNDTPVGGIFISSFNQYINEWGISRSKIDTEKKLYSLDLLRWEIIEWGVKNNCKYYDLTGVKVVNRSAKEDALFRNKAKWGAQLITYPSFSK